MSSPSLPDKAAPEVQTVFPTEYRGEIDVAIEGSPIKYPAPFVSWCSHHFTVLEPRPGSVLSRSNAVPGLAPRVMALTISDHLGGCQVKIVIRHAPEIVGKDDKGNLLIKEVPDEPVAGHIAYTAVGI